MSVKIPPMSPQAKFEIHHDDLKAIVIEDVKRRLDPLYGDTEVRVQFKDCRTSAIDTDMHIMANVEFIVKPKVTRD